MGRLPSSTTSGDRMLYRMYAVLSHASIHPLGVLDARAQGEEGVHVVLAVLAAHLDDDAAAARPRAQERLGVRAAVSVVRPRMCISTYQCF